MGNKELNEKKQAKLKEAYIYWKKSGISQRVVSKEYIQYFPEMNEMQLAGALTAFSHKYKSKLRELEKKKKKMEYELHRLLDIHKFCQDCIEKIEGFIAAVKELNKNDYDYSDFFSEADRFKLRKYFVAGYNQELDIKLNRSNAVFIHLVKKPGYDITKVQWANLELLDYCKINYPEYRRLKYPFCDNPTFSDVINLYEQSLLEIIKLISEYFSSDGLKKQLESLNQEYETKNEILNIYTEEALQSHKKECKSLLQHLRNLSKEINSTSGKNTIVYEVLVYPKVYDEELEEYVSAETPELAGQFDSEEKAVEMLRLCNESAYIQKIDEETLTYLWDDLWYYEDAIKNQRHPFDMP